MSMSTYFPIESVGTVRVYTEPVIDETLRDYGYTWETTVEMGHIEDPDGAHHWVSELVIDKEMTGAEDVEAADAQHASYTTEKVAQRAMSALKNV